MGTKHDPLSEGELARYRLPEPLLRFLADYCARTGRPPAQVRVLDWGCGRGRTVARLREMGYQAFGVEISRETLENGRALFAERGWDPAEVLRQIEADGSTPFDSRTFDVVISQNVFEHVADLGRVAREQARLMKIGGRGLHHFPAHLRPVEGHLRMPFVHWLPKGELRRHAIVMFCRLGVGARWPHLEDLPWPEVARTYHQYSVEKTHYRRPAEIIATFRSNGLEAQLVSADFNATLSRSPLLRRLASAGPVRPAVNGWLSTFHSVDLLIEKKQQPGGHPLG